MLCAQATFSLRVAVGWGINNIITYHIQSLSSYKEIKNTANLKNEAQRDAIKRKGDKTGMGYTKHG